MRFFQGDVYALPWRKRADERFLRTGDATLPTNSSVCLRQYTPTCTLNATATDKTCDGLASKWSISVDDFVEYNDDVDQGCDNLVVGQPVRVHQRDIRPGPRWTDQCFVFFVQYCVSIQGCYPTNTNDVCQQ